MCTLLILLEAEWLEKRWAPLMRKWQISDIMWKPYFWHTKFTRHQHIQDVFLMSDFIKSPSILLCFLLKVEMLIFGQCYNVILIRNINRCAFPCQSGQFRSLKSTF
jgi:hypothetical protein